MGTLEKCKEAVSKIKDEIPNARFGYNGYNYDNWGEFPKGCFLFVSDTTISDTTFRYVNKDALYFNEHPTGSRSEDARHVCEYTGNK